MKTNYQQMDMTPSANIAVKRNRLKHYGDRVYLKNGTNFEIELFNPKQIKVLAKIFLNGIAISNSGIVLLPGQRVFLERWLDDSKKFLFETYEVEDSAEAKAAISQNGLVKVEFYDQVIQQHQSSMTYYGGSDWSPSFPPFAGTTQFSYYTGTIDANSVLDTITTNSIDISSCVTTRAIETGRAEIGAESDQRFVQDMSTYSIFYASFVTLQILPESNKPIEAATIRNYCSACGIRIKSVSWKFCPSCGINLNEYDKVSNP